MNIGTGGASDATDRDTIELSELLMGLWQQRWLIALGLVLGLVVGIVQLHRATYVYTASLKVTPAQSTQSMATSRLGSLASLAGLSGGAAQDAGGRSFLAYTHSVGSRAVAATLAQRPEIMRRIFGGEWDAATGRYVEPRRGLVGRTALAFKSALGIPPTKWRKPDAVRLQDYIADSVRVEQDPESPIVTLKYSNPDPVFAARFLADVHKVLDNNLRVRARDRATQYVAYLSTQLSSAQVLEQRVAIAQALSEQEKARMLTSSTLAFAAEPLDVVTISPRPTSPRPSLILSTALLIGLVFGVVAAALRAQLVKAAP